MRIKKSISDKKIREVADALLDWIERDAVIHIPIRAEVERDALGAWVECKLLVPWDQIRNPFQS